MNNLIITEENSAINQFDFPEDKIIEINLNIEILKMENGLDIFMSDFIVDHLADEVYDSILVPLSFGNTLSDYLGLRLAFHIRTTKTINQCSNIYIYGTERIENLLTNNFSKIIYSYGVGLIDYSKSKITQALTSKYEKLNCRNLSAEISKITLSIPKNYYDNHSISNEWAISRWSSVLNVEDDDGIVKVNSAVNSNLYFKYLKTVYQTNELKPIDERNLIIKNNGRVLVIDDELNKGWGEIFDYLLGELNNVYIDNLGWGFSKKTRENIISESLHKIIHENIDLVILDFRLHPEDFKEQNIKDVTGYKLLEEIKKHNKGIQVIIFSATNKIWNLQELQKAGADGFVIKESIVNSTGDNFTKQSVLNFISSIDDCLGKIFLIDFYKKLEFLEKKLIPRKNFKKSTDPLPKEFVDEVLKWLDLSYSQLTSNLGQNNLTATFLFLFSVLENISNRIIQVENPIRINSSGDQHFEFRSSSKKLMDFRMDKNGDYYNTGNKLVSQKGIPWTQKIINTLDFINGNKRSISNLSQMIKKRNDIVHANVTTGEKISINPEMIIELNSIIYEGLNNIK